MRIEKLCKGNTVEFANNRNSRDRREISTGFEISHVNTCALFQFLLRVPVNITQFLSPRYNFIL